MKTTKSHIAISPQQESSGIEKSIGAVRGKKILSTKILTNQQKASFSTSDNSLTDYNAIEINTLDFDIPTDIKHAIFTSQNGVEAFIQNNVSRAPFDKISCYCVGEKTRALLEENGLKVVKKTQYASELADFIVKSFKKERFYFFCGNIRSDEIPKALKIAKIDFIEIKSYKTTLNTVKFDEKWDIILFFSPSGIRSFTSENELGDSLCVCIGNTTASEAIKKTNKVIVSETTTIESVIEKALS